MKFFIIILTFYFFSFHAHALMKALNTAATGMTAQEANVNTISNNIANANTTGFKKSRAEFDDLLYETVKEAGSRSSATTRYTVGVQVGTGAKLSATRKIFQQGNPQITNRPFDFMINGDGFFAIVMPNNNVRYTRDGSFNVDQTGTLVTKHGHKVFPTLTMPPGTLTVQVSETGNVDAYVNGQVEPINVGQIPVFTFINPVALRSLGKNLFGVTSSSGAPSQMIAGNENAGVIMQGALESSNVSIMTEMTNLIKAQRAYEMNSKVMGIADQMLQTVNNIR